MPSTMYLPLFVLGIICGIHSDSSVNVTTIAASSSQAPPITSSEPTTKLTTTSIPPTTASPPTVPTTEPTTTPAPHVKDGMWIIKDPKTSKICLIAQMQIQLDIPYNTTDKKVLLAHVKVPGNATGTGVCSSSNRTLPQSLTLTWGESNSTSLVTFTFDSNTTAKNFWLSSIAAVVAVNNVTFPNITDTVRQVKLVNSTKHFVTPMDNSYDCQSKLNMPAQLVPDVVNHTAYFTLQHFQLEAFKNDTKTNFSQAIYCEGDNTPDLVPILVGCTLVALVVIVLAVYLWGRRRSQARGYLSM